MLKDMQLKGVKTSRCDQEKYLKLANVLKEKLLEFYPQKLVSLALYGSVARGTARKDSDVDFFIVMRDISKDYFERNRMMRPVLHAVEKSSFYQDMIREGYDPYISYIVLSVEQAGETRPMYFDMVEDAILLYDDGFLKNKFNQLKKRMQELGSKRVFLEDGSWYWELKPDLKPDEVFEI